MAIEGSERPRYALGGRGSCRVSMTVHPGFGKSSISIERDLWRREVWVGVVRKTGGSAHRWLPDEVLLAMMKRGDRDALQELLTRFRQFVEWGCRKELGARVWQGQLEDAISEALVDVVRGCRGFRGESTGEFANWLQVVASNRARKIRGREAGRLASESSATSSAIAEPRSGAATDIFDRLDNGQRELGEQVVENERLRHCLAVLAEQRPRHWEALVLKADGHPMETMALLLSDDDRTVSLQDVKNWVFRARQAMTSCLDQGMGSDA